MYWRMLGGGHLLQVESCSAGVAWGLGYDSTPWVYSGGWGGSHFKGIDTSKSGINAMEDTKYYYVYENQRWNPITGFTAHGLPTDRFDSYLCCVAVWSLVQHSLSFSLGRSEALGMT